MRSMAPSLRMTAVALAVVVLACMVAPTEQFKKIKALKAGAVAAAIGVGKIVPLAAAGGAAGASLIGSAAVSHLINSHHHHGHHHHHFVPVPHHHPVHVPIP